MIEWTPSERETGQDVLEWLAGRIPAAPRGYLRQLLRKGKVTCATGPLFEGQTISAWQAVRLPESARLRELLAQSAAAELEILFESREMLVVAKPAGLAVHSSVGHEADNLTGRVLALLQNRGEPFRAAPIHRLDADTSGPVLFGKGRKAASALGKLFMSAAVTKVYLGLAAGVLPGDGLLESAVPAKGKLKQAATDCRRLACGKGFSLLELRLLSGRTHQIRRQLAELGHPLAGDRRYGGPAAPLLPRLFLHCRQLSFTSPFDGRQVLIEEPLPEDLARCLCALGFSLPVPCDAKPGPPA